MEVQKGVVVLGLIAVVGVLFIFLDSFTGAVFVVCPEGYSYVDTYCVQDECQRERIKCIIDGNFIRLPDCVCWLYIDKFLCGIKGAEKTSVKSPDCTRRGQLDSVCGYYNSSKGMCVISS